MARGLYKDEKTVDIGPWKDAAMRSEVPGEKAYSSAGEENLMLSDQSDEEVETPSAFKI